MDPHQGRAGGTEGEAALSRRTTIFLLTAACLLAGQAALASEEAGTRLAALLAVMQADLAQAPTPGVRARLMESASLLPLMLREAQAPAEEVQQARRLHPALKRGDDRAVRTTLARLGAAHPFRPPPPPADPGRALRIAAAIHREACAGCHDHPRAEALLPAQDLFRLACREAEDAFAARLYLGVKGQADDGFRNPFSAEERAALALWYRTTRPCTRGQVFNLWSSR